MAPPNNSEYSHGENQGIIMQQLKTLEEGQRQIVLALDGFREKMGERVGRAEHSVERIKGEMGIVLTVGKWILMPIFSSIGLSLIGLTVWYLEHRRG